MLSISPSVFLTLPSPQVMILPVLWSQPTSTPVSWKSTSARRTIALTCQWGLCTNPATSKQHTPTESDHVVTKEFVFSDKTNPFFSPSSFSQLFLRGPQHPRTKLLISPGRSVLLRGVGVWCEPPYSPTPRSPSAWAP